jgi:hypothetical protein
MKKLVVFLVIFNLFAFTSPVFSLSDEEIKKKIIQESIMNYPGRCPCPYSTMSNGRSCGRRSAYSKPGGYSPICYPSDVTKEMIDEYRKNR